MGAAAFGAGPPPAMMRPGVAGAAVTFFFSVPLSKPDVQPCITGILVQLSARATCATRASAARARTFPRCQHVSNTY